jgi:Predicted membrane protein
MPRRTRWRGDITSISDGVILVGTLVAWNLVLDWLAYYSPSFRRLIEAPALPLIKDGKWVRINLKKEWITTDEVEAKLREQGIDDLSKVRIAYLESSGELGVIRSEDEEARRHPNRNRK